MADLPDGETILKMYLFVLTQSTNVTDTQTNTQQTPHDGYEAKIAIVDNISLYLE